MNKWKKIYNNNNDNKWKTKKKKKEKYVNQNEIRDKTSPPV
jgi:hypothetical protein